MEELKAEVTGKIRSAIKEKLTELDVFLDDELPEYIMVMVANKKSKSQMVKDLSLFLGDNTTDFTNWLHNLLKNLKPDTADCTSPKSNDTKDGKNDDFEKNSKKRQRLHDIDRKVISDLDDDILALEAHEQDDFLSQELQQENTTTAHISKKEPVVTTACKEKNFPGNSLAVTLASNIIRYIPHNNLVTNVNSVVKSTPEKKSVDKVATKSDNNVEFHSVITANDMLKLAEEDESSYMSSDEKKKCKQPTVKKHALKHVAKSSINKKYQSEPFIISSRTFSDMLSADDEYDPLHPQVGSVASVVRVTERKSSIPPELQANKLLLLRAVDDANKSVMAKQSLNDSYKPTPIKVLATNSKKKNSVKHKQKQEPEVDLRTVINASNAQSHNLYHLEADSALDSNYMDVDYLPSLMQTKLEETVRDSQTEMFSPKGAITKYPSDECINGIKAVLTDKTNSEVHPSPSSPHFVVTLDGVDPQSFKRKRTVSESSQHLEDLDLSLDDTLLPENAEDKLPKKQKLTEKCRYWPACKNGTQCAYHHPTVSCKAFPNCKFGDKCLYIHPNCKFDALCSRKDCPYTHASKRDFSYGKKSSVLYYSPSSRPLCKYFPNCSSLKCPFTHPKLCRYGAECQASRCVYSHMVLPSRSQLKWKASTSC